MNSLDPINEDLTDLIHRINQLKLKRNYLFTQPQL